MRHYGTFQSLGYLCDSLFIHYYNISGLIPFLKSLRTTTEGSIQDGKSSIKGDQENGTVNGAQNGTENGAQENGTENGAQNGTENGAQ